MTSADDSHGRELLLMLAAGGAAVLLALGATVLLHGGPLPLDRHVLAFALRHRTAGSDTVARSVTTLGSTPASGAVALAVAVAAARGRRGWGLAVPPVSLVLAVALRHLLSVAVGRARPPVIDHAVDASGYAFPSGHTTTAVVAAGLVLATLRPSGRAGRAAGVAGVVAIAVAVGLTRLWLGVHWVTDVIAGWGCGALLLALALVAMRRWPARDVGAGRPAGAPHGRHTKRPRQ